MLTLILADAELERVPPQIAGHPSVRVHSKKAQKKGEWLMLDSSLHHKALESVPDGDRRGRPDIVHLFLLTALDSILNIEGGLRVYVHTRDDMLITVDPKTRIMRNYNRFVGLVEQLFHVGRVPREGEPLMTLERDVTLVDAVERAKADRVIVLSEAGKRVAVHEFLEEVGSASENVCIVIGGFPKGEFRSDVSKIAGETFSFHTSALSAWVVAAEVIVNWERIALDRSKGPAEGTAAKASGTLKGSGLNRERFR
ncbi:MAG: 16S rRNA methyltransferase [Euryarchaeota archaeon]|nr:16S rRNA methyltransferase [Euryarchaeota archaeon]